MPTKETNDNDDDEFFEAEDDDREYNGVVDEEVLTAGSMAADAADQLRDRTEANQRLEASGALEKLKKQLGPQATHPYVQDKTNLLRFLRADGGDVSLAATRLKAHLKWRGEVQPETTICRACEANPQSHYMHNVGFDRFKRPVIYSCYELARDRGNVQQNSEHIIANLEALTLHMTAGVETYVWVSDFHGFGLRDCNIRLGTAAIQIFGKHFPERMGAFIFVNAPYIFSAMWNQLKLVIDRRTVRKVRFVEGPLKDGGRPLRAKLAEIFEPRMVDWLVEEMLENRKPEVAANKTWLGALGAASRPAGAPPSAHVAEEPNGHSSEADHKSGHNLLGPPERLARLHVDMERRDAALKAAAPKKT